VTGLKQSLYDLKLIVSSDKRVWAAGIFLVSVTFIWLITSPWRELETAAPQELVKVKVEEKKIDAMIQDFNKSMREGEEERELLKDYLGRFKNELKVEQQNMDWQMNILVNKLGDITEKVDVLANKVGASSIHNALFKEKLKKQRQKRKKKQRIDRSFL
jgi:hypothetical protein